MATNYDNNDNFGDFDDEDLPPALISDEEDEDEIEYIRSGSISDNDADPEDLHDVAIGSKRPRSPNGLATAEQPLKKAVKLYASVNKPKAGDYDSTCRSILKLAIHLFRGKMATEAPWVDGMLSMTWAKGNWMEACKMYDSWTAYNTELIKLVRFHVLSSKLTNIDLQVTDRASHFRGEVKTKVYPMVGPQFGFKAPKSSTDHKAIDHNIKLVRELKTNFGLVYHVSS